MEAVLVDAKMNCANLDLENDELSIHLKQKNDKIKQLQTKISTMEVKLAKAEGHIR